MKKKIIGGIVGLVAFFGCFFATPPEGLTNVSMSTLGILVCALVWMIVGVFPEYVIGIALMIGFVLNTAVTFPVAFGGLSSTSYWLMLGAVVMGVGLSRSGLLKRISLHIMNIFNPTYRGQVLGLTVLGIVIGPFVPSTSAKGAFMGPIAATISESLGFEKDSKGASGIFAALITSVNVMAPMFLSCSWVAMISMGFLPEEYKASWLTWFVRMIPWTVIVFVAMLLFNLNFFKPETEKEFTKEGLKQELKDLGPMNAKEKIAAVVLIGSLALWILERVINFNSAYTAILAMIILIATGLVDRKSFCNDVPWDMLVFMGSIMNISTILKAQGVDVWIADNVSGFIAPLVNRRLLFMFVLIIIIYLVRFLISSFTASMALFSLMLIPVAMANGINPWVITTVVWVSVNVFTFPYQNPPYVLTMAAARQITSHEKMLPWGLTYMGVQFIAFLAIVPYWKLLGLM